MRQSPLRARLTSSVKIMRFSLDTLKRSKHVEHAVTLKTALTSKIGSTITKDVFDPARGADEFVVTRHQHRSRSTHVRRSHAGPIEFSPVFTKQTRLYALSRRHEIRL